MPGLIAHEWIEPRGGSENVLEAIAALYPDAELITPWNNAPHRFPQRTVHELWLARSRLRGRKALSLPVLAAAWRRAVPQEHPYDWVLASTHMFSHHIKPSGLTVGAPKLVYAHTPARYVWTPELDPRGDNTIARVASLALRPLDRRRAKEATAVAGISRYVADRIAATWEIEATVIYPPVEIVSIQAISDWRTELRGDELAILESLPGTFILGASRFISYKRLDQVIQAGEAVGLPVVLAGSGPEAPQLRALAVSASVPVHIIDNPSNAFLYALYQAAAVFVFPPIEDFGIMPIEAMAVGTPAVGSPFGGSAETILEGVSGVHFDDDSPAALGRAVARAMELDRYAVRAASSAFSRERFNVAFHGWMTDSLSSHSGHH